MLNVVKNFCLQKDCCKHFVFKIDNFILAIFIYSDIANALIISELVSKNSKNNTLTSTLKNEVLPEHHDTRHNGIHHNDTWLNG